MLMDDVGHAIGKIGCDLPVFIGIEIIQISANGGSLFVPFSKEKN